MPFFTILGHLAASGYVGGRLLGEHSQRRKDRAMREFSEKFQKMYTDPELEAKLKERIEDPEYYDWVWDRLESYKRNRGKYFLWRRSDSRWKYVGKERKPFFERGSLYGRTKRDTEWLAANRHQALWMLIQTYGRMTQYDARNLMMHSTYNDMCHYQHRHPADLYLNDTWSALSEAPLELVDMPDGWPEDRIPPNEVPEHR